MKFQQQFETDRIISRAEFAELTGISRTTLWRLLNSGDLPEAVKIKGRILGFRESAYLAWLEKKLITINKKAYDFRCLRHF